MATEWKHTRLILWANVVGVTLAALVLLSAALDRSIASSPNFGALVVSLALVCVFLTVTTALAASKLSAAVVRIAETLSRQIASGDLVMSFPKDQQGATGRLMTALSKLGENYRASLDLVGRRADELATLEFITTTINRTLDLQEVLDASLREALKTVKWDVGAIFMWDERSRTLNMVSYTGLSEEVVRQNISYELGEGLIGMTAQDRQTYIASSNFRDPRDAPDASPGLPSHQINLPLVAVPGQLMGTLIVGSYRQEDLKPDQISLLKTVSSQIALAIDKAQLYTKVSEHAGELEEIVKARTDQLSQAIDELWIALKESQEADRLKSLLLSTVSHELRTPLATIKGNVSLLREHHGRIPKAQWPQHLQDIEEETDKLTELIGNLLDMSRLEAGSLHIQAIPVEIVGIIRAAHEAFRRRAPDRFVSLKLPMHPLHCLGDARRIGQVVSNLLDNAAKYSQRDKSIMIRVRKRREEVIVTVIDCGDGISPADQTRIFDRFYQVTPSRDTRRDGIGLGLSICKGLVETQNGHIWVRSKVGMGSAFSFSLPGLSLAV